MIPCSRAIRDLVRKETLGEVLLSLHHQVYEEACDNLVLLPTIVERVRLEIDVELL